MMSILEQHIKTFEDILKPLNYENNMILGGTSILDFYGIKLNRKPKDLDVIIFNPTEGQRLFLKKYEKYNEFNSKNKPSKKEFEKNKYASKNGKYFNDVLRIKKDGKYIDIIFLNEKMKKYPRPIFNNYKLEKIDDIISNKIAYGRSKDIEDIKKMKKLNFNILKSNKESNEEDVDSEWKMYPESVPTIKKNYFSCICPLFVELKNGDKVICYYQKIKLEDGFRTISSLYDPVFICEEKLSRYNGQILNEKIVKWKYLK